MATWKQWSMNTITSPKAPGVPFTISGKAEALGEDPETGQDLPAPCEVTVRVNDTEIGAARASIAAKKWSIQYTPPSDGTYTINARLQELIGQQRHPVQKETTIQVHELDAPDIQVTKPEINQRYEEPGPEFSVDVSFTVEDESNIDYIILRFKNSSDVNVFPDKRRDIGESFASWDETFNGFGIDEYTLEIEAADEYGKKSSSTRAFKTIDRGLPELVVESHSVDVPNKITWSPGVKTTVTGSAFDVGSGIKEIAWILDDLFQGSVDDTSGEGDPPWSDWEQEVTFSDSGIHTVKIVCTDMANPENENIEIITFDLVLAFRFEHIDFFSYYQDLVELAYIRLMTRDGSPINVENLDQEYLQPFMHLLESKNNQVARRDVSQVRITIEVLRRYLNDYQERDGYKLEVYQELLNRIGVHYDELRLIRNGEGATST